MSRPLHRSFRRAVALAAGLLAMPHPALAASAYVALGDSITFGETNLAYAPSYGDRGYVSLFANALGASHGGARPIVTNLAIDGETAASFFAGAGRTPPVGGRTDAPLQAENLNYTAPTQTQAQLFATTVARQQALGNSIDTISITLGFNELAALASLPPATALADIQPTLSSYSLNYSAVLADVHALAPNAKVYLLNYYNPFPADPSSPAAPIFNAGGKALNATIANLAAQFGATYVDDASAFLGHEAAYTYLDDQPHSSAVADPFGGVLPIGNVHPNAEGYAAIFDQVRSASAAPEPKTWALMLIGFGITGTALRRRRRNQRPPCSGAIRDC